MHYISREYMFCASHRIEGHPKCGRDHGHNYIVRVGIQQRVLNNTGMVMDYADLDREVKPIIEAMDHRRLVSKSNIRAECQYSAVALRLGHAYLTETNQSTAEELSARIHTLVVGKLMFAANDVTVEVIETPKSSAEYTGE